jgi:O-antigen ligase
MIYAFLTCLIPAISVFRSIRAIDFNLAFKWIFIGYVILIPIFYYNNPLLFSFIDAGVRLSGNIAMNTISFGHYGVTLALLALFWTKQSDQIWQTVLSILLICVGIFIMLRSGSRGPLITMIGCLIFFFAARQRSYVGSLCILLLFVVLLLSFSTVLLDKIQELSPVMASRLSLSGTETQFEELTSGRSGLYGIAIAKFVNHPIIGDSFAIFSQNGSFTYSHNIVLDAFMGLGLFGGILFIVMLFFAVQSSFQMVLNQELNWWLALLCIQSIISYMFSGCFYQAESLNVLLIILLYRCRCETLADQ